MNNAHAPRSATFTSVGGWVYDDRHNRASILVWGSEDAAKDALRTLLAEKSVETP